jgi:hypothetical protein
VLKYASGHSGAWQTEVVPHAKPLTGWTSLALDGQGKAHIAVYDQLNRDVKYFHMTQDQWEYEVVASEGVGTGECTVSLALDSLGQARISYCGQQGLQYAVRTRRPYALYLPALTHGLGRPPAA